MQFLKIAAAVFLVAAVQVHATAAACTVKCDARGKGPVCGASGATLKTFANECLLEFAKCDDAALTLHATTSCEEAAAAPKTNHVRATIRSNDKPLDTCVDEFCTRELEQLCGSDKVTYNNQCLFRNAQCHNKALKLAHDGPCA